MTKEISQHSFGDIVRLHSLVRLASSPAQSNRASRVVNEAAAALNIQACVFHHCWEDGRSEIMAAHSRPGVGAEMLSPLAARLLKEVWRTRRSLVKNDLSSDLHDDPLVCSGAINNYLGVPLFDSRGEVFGVGSLFSDYSGPFDENDLWWMETAAHLASAASACESLQKRLRALERESEESQGSLAVASLSTIKDGLAGQSGNLSVLVVDDDQSVNTMVRRFLTRQGHQVDAASDGVVALRMFRPSIYDVVISDIVMPGMNGWELVAALHAVAPNLPVVIMTGYSSSNNSVWNKHFLQEQGVTAVLNKPIDFHYLSSILEGLSLKKRQAQRAPLAS